MKNNKTKNAVNGAYPPTSPHFLYAGPNYKRWLEVGTQRLTPREWSPAQIELFKTTDPARFAAWFKNNDLNEKDINTVDADALRDNSDAGAVGNPDNE